MEEYKDCLDVIRVAATNLAELDLWIELTESTGHLRASALLRQDKEDYLSSLLRSADRVRELSRIDS